jgi:hypothetical protein
MSIPRKCMNSALYFRAASFPAGIKILTHYNSTGDEYVKVKQGTAWVAYLDARQEQTSIMTDLSEREMVQEWMENKKYSREKILAVVRNNKGRKIKQYKVAETSKPPLTRRQKYTPLSPIPRNPSRIPMPPPAASALEMACTLFKGNICIIILKLYNDSCLN